ncbi:MAG: aminotransferase class I/II-fold pyridoxal phosphate-dependent enzyme, partial [Pseudomonadales bacterium]
MSFSNRSRSVLPFKAMQMMAAANALEEAGKRVIHLEVGQPDFSAPEYVRRKALEAIQAGRMGYSNAEGLPELREVIASFYQQRFGIEIPSRRVLITAGASGALALLIPLLTDPGEGWLLPDPGYPSYRHFVSAYGCEPQALRLRAENQFQPSSCQIEQHWKSNTRALVLASPSNPAGTQIDESLARDLIEVVQHKGGHVVADEIYQGVNPDGEPLPTMLSHANDAFIV